MTTNQAALAIARKAIAGLKTVLINAATDRDGKRFDYIESRSLSRIYVADSIQKAEQVLAALDQAPSAAQPVAYMYSKGEHVFVTRENESRFHHGYAETALYAAPVSAPAPADKGSHD